MATICPTSDPYPARHHRYLAHIRSAPGQPRPPPRGPHAACRSLIISFISQSSVEFWSNSLHRYQLCISCQQLCITLKVAPVVKLLWSSAPNVGNSFTPQGLISDHLGSWRSLYVWPQESHQALHWQDRSDLGLTTVWWLNVIRDAQLSFCSDCHCPVLTPVMGDGLTLNTVYVLAGLFFRDLDFQCNIS